MILIRLIQSKLPFHFKLPGAGWIYLQFVRKVDVMFVVDSMASEWQAESTHFSKQNQQKIQPNHLWELTVDSISDFVRNFHPEPCSNPPVAQCVSSANIRFVTGRKCTRLVGTGAKESRLTWPRLLAYRMRRQSRKHTQDNLLSCGHCLTVAWCVRSQGCGFD